MTKFLSFLVLILLTGQLFGQNVDYSQDSTTLFFPDFQKTKNWIHADNYRGKNTYQKDMTLEKALKLIKSETNYWSLRPAINWCIDNYKLSVPILLDMLSDTTNVGITSTEGIIFLGRPVFRKSVTKVVGCISYPLIRDDIYTIAGRSSHILNLLTNENFLIVISSTSYSELQCYKELWKSWFRRL